MLWALSKITDFWTFKQKKNKGKDVRLKILRNFN